MLASQQNEKTPLLLPLKSLKNPCMATSENGSRVKNKGGKDRDSSCRCSSIAHLGTVVVEK